MIRTLDVYLGRSLVQTTGFTLLVLVGISTLIKFIEQLKSVGRGTFDIMDALLYTLYSVPGELVVFFPMAVLIGGLTGLGALASNSELIVMQAAGMSRLQIISSVMKTAVLLALCMMAIGEWGAPQAEKIAHDLKSRAIHGGEVFNAQKGIWAKDGNNFINIANVDQLGILQDINIYQFDEALSLNSIIRAKSGHARNDGWLFKGVETVSLDGESINSNKQAELFYSSALNAEKLGVVSIDPDSLSFSGLWSYLGYLKQNDQDTSTYELALWRKIVQPITVGVMLLVALSFIFGPLRSVSMGARIIMGVVTGIAFHLTNEIFGPIVMVYQVPAAFGAIMPSILFIVFASYLLKRRT
ncbi:LPS export ABC transporter permease LptG [Pseudoalteromonas xiamenensis]|uniref:LPS export ABC transporter permease LptG n=1 Tax=Pseudoalteromonas xiamenensis TaxID=882626 RepID=UPI0027E3CE97|nr:LPS export ABC transporter permease LptG [Pseudoalteromonas xiamenensis]WMN61094.1 LPS export ABC transporter permease LptG [Pseudoalteromonas xiamenensis]